jgi:hypothetical protein
MFSVLLQSLPFWRLLKDWHTFYYVCPEQALVTDPVHAAPKIDFGDSFVMRSKRKTCFY